MSKNIFVNQLNNIIEEFKSLQEKSEYNDLSDLPKADRQSLVTRGIAAVNRISGPKSTYSDEIKRILNKLPTLHRHTSSIIGVVQALKKDIDSGYIQSLAELINGEIFSEFLDMAKYLADKGYKDAAAVIAGSTLESHIRKLCIKNRIPIERTDREGKKLSVKTDGLNSELVKAEIYSKLDQKSITAWLDLRNKAAHGHYCAYKADQVTNLISGVRDFITRNPA